MVFDKEFILTYINMFTIVFGGHAMIWALQADTFKGDSYGYHQTVSWGFPFTVYDNSTGNGDIMVLALVANIFFILVVSASVSIAFRFYSTRNKDYSQNMDE